MPTYLPTLNWPIYSGWTNFTPTIPKLYWDVYSQEQRTKELCKNYWKSEQYLDFIAKVTNEWGEEVANELNSEIEKMWQAVNSGYKDAISKWLVEDLPDLISAAMKMVFFGLTDDGYFCAWIPNSWQGIIFDTVADYLNENYGCLVLSY